MYRFTYLFLSDLFIYNFKVNLNSKFFQSYFFQSILNVKSNGFQLFCYVDRL